MYDEKRRKRTKSDNVVAVPKQLAIITLKAYTGALGFIPNEAAYLEMYPEHVTERLLFEKGRLKTNSTSICEMEKMLEELRTDVGIRKMDIGLLNIIYSIYWNRYQENDYKNNNPYVRIYMPDLLEAYGVARNCNQKRIDQIVFAIWKFSQTLGVLKVQEGAREKKLRYTVIQDCTYDIKTNIVSFSSPYLAFLSVALHRAAIKKDKNGNEVRDANGNLKFWPEHTFLVASNIVKARNIAAIENIRLIVTLIEQAGSSSIPHVSAHTLIERNLYLKQQLDEVQPKNRQQVLNRVFSYTWKLLLEYTELEERYSEIRLPKSDDKTQWPKYKSLKESVFEFPHGGKKRNRNAY